MHICRTWGGIHAGIVYLFHMCVQRVGSPLFYIFKDSLSKYFLIYLHSVVYTFDCFCSQNEVRSHTFKRSSSSTTINLYTGHNRWQWIELRIVPFYNLAYFIWSEYILSLISVRRHTLFVDDFTYLASSIFEVFLWNRL